MSHVHEQVVPLRLPIPVAGVQGTLALDLQPRLDPPPRTGAEGGSGGDVVSIDERWRRDAEGWSRRFAQAAVEIVGGDRPITQLLRWTTEEVYDDLQRRAQLVARAGGHRPGQGRVQPGRPRVRSVHTCFVSREVVESSVHVGYGVRSRALAARFELRRQPQGQRWVCTALEFA
ncbi:Rv3235 family protein [Nocardioides ferulae]|uniref:Rv3235 family protein n=1 Tax=Nocardioides ferulae TaxID=2340821 RepID=UPI000EAF4BA7|nr:Rv3235 family protein [Nocardioides ferulae]